MVIILHIKLLDYRFYIKYRFTILNIYTHVTFVYGSTEFYKLNANSLEHNNNSRITRIQLTRDLIVANEVWFKLYK